MVALRHHPSLWWAPAALLVVALFPWPYGYYNLLRLVVFFVSAWIAYEQWRHDNAVSGWVVAFGGIALLYNPLLSIHLTRDIWSVLNIATAVAFLGHLRALRELVGRGSNKIGHLRALAQGLGVRMPKFLPRRPLSDATRRMRDESD